MKLKLENGKTFTPKDSHPIHCPDHNVTVKWGKLSAMQKIAVSEGIDINGSCILLPKNS